MRKGILLIALVTVVFCTPLITSLAIAEDQESNPVDIRKLEQQIEQLKQELEQLKAASQSTDEKQQMLTETQERLDAVERKAALDRLNFTGEIRVANDTIRGTQAAYYNGLMIQKGVVDTMFYMMTNRGGIPMTGDSAAYYSALAANNATHYSDYLLFTSSLTFHQLKAAMSLFPPAQQQMLMGILMPAAAIPEREYNNDIFYTTRLRLNMKSEITDNLSFTGRLAMYKAWGDSTGVQVFDGQPNSMNMDGTTTSVPNSDIVRVDRAYFDWQRIGGSKWYLSIGRRPSTGGPPTEIREGRLRGGTPLGHVVDFQFDGVTVGYSLNSEKLPGAVFRFCYGLGYESGFGSGDQLKAPADRLKDAHFGGFNLDLLSTDRMFLQATILRAFNVTDGFNSLVVFTVDPVTGNSIPGAAVQRYTPSTNLGSINLGAVAMERVDGPVHWFGSVAFSSTDPDNVTTPFGGLLSDPFGIPESHSGWSLYTGARYDFNKDRTQLGAEYNYGSQYWFNFTQAADDVVFPKLASRGNVFEAYLNHNVSKHFQIRASGIYYDFVYSGSGWHVGLPKKLDEMPVLGFPTYKDAFDLKLAATVKF